jgi:hypothetical protein
VGHPGAKPKVYLKDDVNGHAVGAGLQDVRTYKFMVTPGRSVVKNYSRCAFNRLYAV